MSKRRKSFSKRRQLVVPSFLKPLPAEVKVALPALAALDASAQLKPLLQACAAYLKGTRFTAAQAALQAKALGMEPREYGRVFGPRS